MPLLQQLALLSWPELRHQPWRHLTALMAVMLGVALAFSVQLINDSALSEFSAAVRSVNGQPDFELRAQGAGFDEALYARVAADPRVAVASPVVELESHAHPGDGGERLPLRVLGIDALQAAQIAPELLPRLADDAPDDRAARFDPDAVYLNAAARARLGGAGAALSTLRVQSGIRILELPVRGSVAAAGPPLAVLDIAGAQQHFGWLGRISRIDVRLVPGASREALLSDLSLPAGVRAALPGEAAQRISNVSRAYRVNLTVLALVALFTGAFLVFSILSLSVARRLPQLALLGVLGLSARERLRLVLAESAAARRRRQRPRGRPGHRPGDAGAAPARRRPRRWLLPGHRTGAALQPRGGIRLCRAGRRCRAVRRLAAGAHRPAHRTGAGAQGPRCRRAWTPPPLAGPRADRHCRRARVRAADRRSAARRLRGGGAAAAGRHRRGSRSRRCLAAPAARHAPAPAAAGAAARTPPASRGDDRGRRRGRQPRAGGRADGDGRELPHLGHGLARQRAAGRPVCAQCRHRCRRQRLAAGRHRARGGGAARRRTGRDAARDAGAVRSAASGGGADRTPARRPAAQPAAGRRNRADRPGCRRGVGQRGDGIAVRCPPGQPDHAAAARRPAHRGPGGRCLARLRTPERRDHDRPRRLRAADRRPPRQRPGAVAEGGCSRRRGAGRPAPAGRGGRGRRKRRARVAARICLRRGHPRALAAHLRPQFCGHLLAAGGRDRHRPVRHRGQLLGPGAGAAQGVRTAAAPRPDAAPGAHAGRRRGRGLVGHRRAARAAARASRSA